MDIYIGSIVIDVNDLVRMKDFWQSALGYEVSVYEEDDWMKLEPSDQQRVTVSLQKVPEKKTEKNRLHLDLYSKSPQQEVERLVALGARLVEGPREDRDFILLADPEDNLFCVIDKSGD